MLIIWAYLGPALEHLGAAVIQRSRFPGAAVILHRRLVSFFFVSQTIRIHVGTAASPFGLEHTSFLKRGTRTNRFTTESKFLAGCRYIQYLYVMLFSCIALYIRTERACIPRRILGHCSTSIQLCGRLKLPIRNHGDYCIPDSKPDTKQYKKNTNKSRKSQKTKKHNPKQFQRN